MKGGKVTKKVSLILIFMVFVKVSATVYVAERAPLGNTNFAVKLRLYLFY